MRPHHAFATLLTFLPLLGCNRTPDHTPAPSTAQPEKAYGWVTIYDGQEGMSYKGAVWWSLEDTDKLRFKVSSKVPVHVGVIPRQIEKKEIPSLDARAMECSQIDTTESEGECALPNRESTFIIRDAQPLESENPRVIHRTHLMNVKVETWGCTSCPQKPAPRGR
jgi:hypothetical protein